MRISDWSSDVCSSDLPRTRLLGERENGHAQRIDVFGRRSFLAPGGMGGAVRGCLVRSALVESRRRGETLTEDDRRTPAVGPVEVLGADRAMRDADGGQFAR